MVKAIVPKGLKKGVYLGKVAIRSTGRFDIQTKTKTIEGIGHKYCHIVQRGDGYSYNYKECDPISDILASVLRAKQSKRSKKITKSLSQILL